MKFIERTYIKKSKPTKPEWSHFFSHYNQMDQPTFYLAEFIWENKSLLLDVLPESIELYAPENSYFSDREYVIDPKPRNPSKFIYTLPSVKINVICGLLDWEGPVFCFLKSLDRNADFMSSWVIEVSETSENIKVTLGFDDGVDKELSEPMNGKREGVF